MAEVISRFKLGEKSSIAIAAANIQELTENNEKNRGYYKSFRSLNCSKEDLKRSFYFLKDCILFCKEEPIYNNKEMLSNLRFLEMNVVLNYLDVESDQIPTDKIQNFRYGQQFKLNESLDVKQLEELKLIDWRSKEHWRFWVIEYGIESSLGKFCLERANE